MKKPLIITREEAHKIDWEQAKIKATVLETMIQAGLAKPFISLRQAYQVFGEGLIDRWIKEKLITPQKDGDNNSTVRLDLQRLILLQGESNRIAYYQYKYQEQ